MSVVSILRIRRPITRGLPWDCPLQTPNVTTEKDCVDGCAWPRSYVCAILNTQIQLSPEYLTDGLFSAAATAVVKCAQIKGLSNQTDGTCEFPVSLNHHRLFQITDMPRETDATVPLVVWTKQVIRICH
jgi:hypothetical protein